MKKTIEIPYVCQGQKVKKYLQEKQYIKIHSGEINLKILACFEQRFISVYREDAQPFSGAADDGDNIIFDVCLILSTTKNQTDITNKIF